MRTKQNPIKDLLSGRLSREEFVQQNQPGAGPETFFDDAGKKWLIIKGQGIHFHLPDNGRN